MSVFEIVNGSIYMGDMPIIGHGCSTQEDMLTYCKVMNANIDPEAEKRAKEREEAIAKLSTKSKQDIIDLLSKP